jgi:hypothetical protein
VTDESLLCRLLTLAMELAAEPAADVRDARAEVPPLMAEETSPRREETMLPWALAAPAARRVVAMNEKRILIDLVVEER